jgi:hypothetical protein
MSYFEDASLVYIPSAVKDGKTYSIKPTDGSGDLTFSRGSDIEATRVASNGYIQKAAVNLLLQSNSFDTTWTTTDSSVTSGQTGYDGSSDAWLLEATATSSSLRQNYSASGVFCFSAYAKAGSTDWIRLRFDNTSTADANVWFNLSDGSIGASNGIAPYTENIGDGWWRLVVQTNTSDLNNLRILTAASDGANPALGDYVYIQDAQLNYGLVAQEYQETTTTSVVTGITNDMPRLDYSGGASCPSLLLEPSRANLFTYDTYLNGLTFTQATATQNTDISPEGVQNAARLYDNTSSSQHRVNETISVTNGTTYTWSVFIKKGTLRYCYLISTADGTMRYFFDLQEGTAITSGGKIEDYGNGWFRISGQVTASTTGSVIFGLNLANNGSNATYEGTGTDYHILYGLQCEVGSYPTSLIPCDGTSATRTGDDTEVIDLQANGIFGASAGTIFLDIKRAVSRDSTEIQWQWRDDANVLALRLYYKEEGECSIFTFYNNRDGEFITGNETIGYSPKIAISYDGTSRLKIFGNGVELTKTGGNFQTNVALDKMQQLTNLWNITEFSKILFFPTALSDSDCIALTSL